MIKKARHRRLMSCTRELVIRAEEMHQIDLYGVTADQVVAYVFGQYRMDIDEEEAVRYLKAVLVARGHSIAHLVNP